MAEIEALRARAMASIPLSARRHRLPLADDKEEGELSSSSDKEMPNGATGEVGGCGSRRTEVLDLERQKLDSSRALKSGKSGLCNAAPISSDVQPHNQPPQKHNNHVTSGWHRPPRGDENLVIDFSDGSEGDSHESGNARTTDFDDKINAFGVDVRKKSGPFQRIKSKATLQVSKTQSRTMPKHIAANRTFTSVVSKLTGQHSGPSRTSSYGRGTQVLKMKSQSKYMDCQKPRNNRGVNSTSKELEFLRQQIALKESELKHQLRAVPLGKETPLGSDGELYTLKEENIEKPKVARPIKLGMEANELENKRQKTGENSHNKVDSELRKKPVVGLHKKKDDQLSTETFTEAGASCKDIHSSNMLNERAKLNQTSIPDDNIRHEIFVPKKQIPLGSSQLNKIDKAHEPDASSQHDLSRNNHDAIISSDKKQQLASPTPHDVPYRGRNLPNLEDFSLISKSNATNIQALLNFEELQDKKLEEAQELRRKCELEERTALKAYRLAQRALIDANEKCSHLYRERELSSAQIRAYIMENSCSLWPFTRQRQEESWPVSFGSVSGFDVNLLPSMSCQIKNGALDQKGNYADSHFAGQDSADTFFKCNPELACNPSISPLEPSLLDDKNAVCPTGKMGIVSAIKPVTLLSSKSSPSRLVSNDAEEAHKGDMSLKDQVENSSLLESSIKSQAFARLGERTLSNVANQELMTSSFEEHNQDGSVLEVSLRNELFARLGMRNLTDKSGSINSKKNHDYEAGQMIVELDKTDAVTHDPSFLSNEELLAGDKQKADEKGVHTAHYIHVHGDHKTLISDDGSSQSSGHEESSIGGEPHNPLPSFFHLPSSDIKVVYKHFQKHDVLGSCKQMLFSKESIREVHNTTEAPNILLKKDDSLNSLYGIHVDPFWPLCMFELRGKCNSDQCPWQHIRDSSGRGSGQPLFSSSSDCHAPSSSTGGECEYDCGSFHCPCCYIMPIPTYRIGSCLVKAEPTSSRHIRSVWQYGRMGFCNSCGTPIVVSRSFPPDSIYLSSGVCHIEDHEKWSKSSLLRQTIEDRVTQQMHCSNDCEQSLELALEYFISNTNRKEGRKKALAVLSRSIEADPNSVVLWVSYLHIFYEKEKTLGEDDMFLHAIQHNEGSYELWIMYINSRVEYQSCLDAYETAVKSFILLARSSVKEFRESSACLLDLTLHMIDFLRMSGNVDKAISFVEGLLPSTVELASLGKTTASDVVACLNVCDKSILLICCVYLLMYKKLPEVVVKRLNFEQQLPFDMEWPYIHLTDEDKQSAVELMGVAVNNENLGANSGEEWELEGAMRPKHFLAVSHVKFIMMIEDLEHGKLMLYKYMKLYPFCIELSLMCARMQEERLTEVDGLKGFEEVLQSWPKKVPGFHCIWNQYLEFALENGMTSLAKGLIIRWFCALGELQNYHGQMSDSDGSSETSDPAESNSPSYAPQRDELFRLLNLSLYQHLNSKKVESLETVDEALRFSSEEDFAHCASEHAASKLWKSLEPLEDIIALLLNYLMDHRAASTSIIEPLSRRFISSIRKPRIRYLVNKVLGPSSVKTHLMNSILQVLYGPYLLPEKFSAESLVDFIEGLTQIHPASYELALSVCKVVLKTNWAGSSSTSMIFWASSVLVNSIFQAFPIAPEHIWVEAIQVLGKLGIRVILERFYQFALSVYPFSVNLWQSYIDFSKVGGSVSTIIETAEERGISSKLHTDVEV